MTMSRSSWNTFMKNKEPVFCTFHLVTRKFKSNYPRYLKFLFSRFISHKNWLRLRKSITLNNDELIRESNYP